MNPTVTLVLSRLSLKPQTVYEIAEEIHFHPVTVGRILLRALGGRVVREPLSNGTSRWTYGWRLRCKGCGR